MGGGAPIVVQSMTTTDTRNVKATVRQIIRLAKAGCEIVRVAVPDEEAASVLGAIKSKSPLPLIADVHFHERIALEAIRQGVDGLRINPGNMRQEGIKKVVKAAKERSVPIRIGVNAGSLEKDLQKKYGGPTAAALAESALRNTAFLEEFGFEAIKLSLKASDVPTMIEAYRTIARQTDYPLHLGVTEAGTLVASAIKSAIGIGLLLNEGIGDTIRISITGDPVAEMGVAFGILRALHLRDVGPDIIACPTCGRCEIDLARLVREVEKKLSGRKTPIKIALMGCVVNGPGEAAEADIGIAGGRGMGLLFKKGKSIRKIPEADFVTVLMEEIDRINGQ